MVSIVPLLATLSTPLPAVSVETPGSLGEVFDQVAARDLHATPADPRSLSKREEWLRDKELRPDLHLSDAALANAQREAAAAEKKAAATRRRQGDKPALATPVNLPGVRIEPVTTLFNVWTHEAFPILPGDPMEVQVHTFLRDHYTNQATQMDTRLVDVLARAARKFSARRIEIVSGYRSPKYNLMLRKKGHQVARQSQHVEGHAVDFRIRGVPTRSLLAFVRSLRLGGVGFYPHSQFVHSDTGKVRYWTGS
ncbi:MAG TPA: DUF882 domain-containing protein [Polyangia bacterium]|nr:DUF882 domain-containing protein [Polyangia bacterium]